jgi:hypothetical protein
LAKLIKKHQKIYEARKLLELPERATEVKNSSFAPILFVKSFNPPKAGKTARAEINF